MNDPTEQVRVKYVRVTNGNDFLYTDRHDGVPIKIAAGESKNLPLDQAMHLFGWHPQVSREDMFKHIQRRQGWNTTKYLEIDPVTKKTIAETIFDKFRLEPIMYKLVEVEHDPLNPIPADPELPKVEPEEAPRIPRRVDVRA